VQATKPDDPGEGSGEAEVRQALGERIRALRLEKHMSGRKLAELVGVSSGYISQVERGQVMPSVGTLLKLVSCLGSSMGELFDVGSPVTRVVRKEERRVYESTPTRFEARLSSGDDGELEVFWGRMLPGDDSGEHLFAHGSKAESVYVLAGAVTVFVGDERHDLREGDCLTFPGSLAHGWRNESGRPAELLWINTPATY